ncbi:hypothetical protein CBR_g31161 [Chara braunii]|uniref:Uncharacterized protein n=1 Tax=Chara braunii TaxID=69332 RepID=A0A388LEI0_CHABU|nr:hypothetical protein CBR_g31161 [Chara braunii]|eukprot:GBG80704.1 hypothetical protein CBR_g31161 [Chara braunii]
MVLSAHNLLLFAYTCMTVWAVGVVVCAVFSRLCRSVFRACMTVWVVGAVVCAVFSRLCRSVFRARSLRRRRSSSSTEMDVRMGNGGRHSDLPIQQGMPCVQDLNACPVAGMPQGLCFDGSPSSEVHSHLRQLPDLHVGFRGGRAARVDGGARLPPHMLPLPDNIHVFIREEVYKVMDQYYHDDPSAVSKHILDSGNPIEEDFGAAPSRSPADTSAGSESIAAAARAGAARRRTNARAGAMTELKSMLVDYGNLTGEAARDAAKEAARMQSDDRARSDSDFREVMTSVADELRTNNNNLCSTIATLTATLQQGPQPSTQ